MAYPSNFIGPIPPQPKPAPAITPKLAPPVPQTAPATQTTPATPTITVSPTMNASELNKEPASFFDIQKLLKDNQTRQDKLFSDITGFFTPTQEELSQQGVVTGIQNQFNTLQDTIGQKQLNVQDQIDRLGIQPGVTTGVASRQQAEAARQGNVELSRMALQSSALSRQQQVAVQTLQNMQASRGAKLEAAKFLYDATKNSVEDTLKMYQMTQPQNISFQIDKVTGEGVAIMKNPVTGEVYTKNVGKVIQGEKPSIDTQVISVGGRQQLINSQTGQVIKDLGPVTRVSTGGGGGGSSSALVQAIMENPALYKTLTPTQKGALLPGLKAAGIDLGDLTERPLSDTAIKEISQSESALMNLQELKTKIQGNEKFLGPISGLQRLNPWSEARKVQADIDRVKQQVGKSLEGGVLRKEDEEKYKKILSTLSDTPSTAMYKIDALISQIQRDVDNYKLIQQQTGRNVPESDQAPSIESLRTKYNY